MLQEPPTSAPTAFANLGGHSFLMLTTFDRHGQPVASRVQFAQDGDKLYVVCALTADFVARIHDNAQVEVAPADEGGEIGGHSVEAMAVILAPENAAAARRAFGGHALGERLQSKLHEWMLVLRGSRMVCLEITPM
jgi:PPOX class probable F420-dependent enzyme